MKRFSSIASKVAFFVAGSAVIATAFVTNPAIAEDAHSLLKAWGDNTCNSAFACEAFKNTGSGVAIVSAGTSGAGVAASSNTGSAVDARSTSAVGVLARSNNGAAVDARSTLAEGVVAVSGRSNAVRGTTTNPSGSRTPRSGVLGVDSSTDGGAGNFGVSGFSANGTGVEGTTTHISNDFSSSSGVVGLDLSTDGGRGNIGVSGSSTNGTGVKGTTKGIPDSPGADVAGVIGLSRATDCCSAGVVGRGLSLGVLASGLVAVEAEASAGGTSVQGISNKGTVNENIGVYADAEQGIGDVGLAATSDGVPLSAYEFFGNTNPTAIVQGGTGDPATNSLVTEDIYQNPTFWVDNGGNAHVRGFLYTGGPCSAGCAKPKGSASREVQRYMPQEAVPTIEDVGEAQLSSGSAYVRIDPAFANVMDSKATYLVFVTPQGPTRELYVTNKTPQGFQVQEMGGNASVAFDYRIVAKPFGQSAPRLPMITGPTLPKPPSLPRLPRLTHNLTNIHH